MADFLNYLDDFNNKHQKNVQQSKPIVKKVEQQQSISKPKVLCMNVEIRTVEGAQKVIDKLQEWISRQEPKEHFELKETQTNVTPKYKIPPKKVIKNPILETKSRAIDILNGLPENSNEIIITENIHNTSINTSRHQSQKTNIETVAGHASALL